MSNNNEGCRIIYITTDCNLDCEYCYEKRKRDDGFPILNANDEDIKLFSNSIVNHPDENVVGVLFGGEPFIRPDILNKTFDYVLNECNKSNKGVHFNITTNGTLLIKNQNLVKKLINSKTATIEISYDGINHDKRIFKDGSSSKECVEENIKWMIKNKLPFKISTVIEKDDPNFLEIIIDISVRFKPVAITLRILNSECIDIGIPVKNQLKKLFLITGIPICEQVCDICDLCSNKKEHTNYEYIIPGKQVERTNYKNIKEYTFEHF